MLACDYSGLKPNPDGSSSLEAVAGRGILEDSTTGGVFGSPGVWYVVVQNGPQRTHYVTGFESLVPTRFQSNQEVFAQGSQQLPGFPDGTLRNVHYLLAGNFILGLDFYNCPPGTASCITGRPPNLVGKVWAPSVAAHNALGRYARHRNSTNFLGSFDPSIPIKILVDAQGNPILSNGEIVSFSVDSVSSSNCVEGCPPNTLDCGGCCLDCMDIFNQISSVRNELKSIN